MNLQVRISTLQCNLSSDQLLMLYCPLISMSHYAAPCIYPKALESFLCNSESERVRRSGEIFEQPSIAAVDLHESQMREIVCVSISTDVFDSATSLVLRLSQASQSGGEEIYLAHRARKSLDCLRRLSGSFEVMQSLSRTS